MIPLALGARGGGLRVLCLGAHSDDIEIGAGGTLLSLLDQSPDVTVRWVCFSGLGLREEEALRSAEVFLSGAASAEVEVLGFRDGFFPHQWADIKASFESLKSFSPDLVITHRGADRHQDHRVLAELAWNTFRDHLILEYEIPKYDADLTAPNVYVPLARAHVDRKVELLLECFGSQRSKQWFTDETFRALLRLRGIECASPTGYAEGFHVRKATIGLNTVSEPS